MLIIYFQIINHFCSSMNKNIYFPRHLKKLNQYNLCMYIDIHIQLI